VPLVEELLPRRRVGPDDVFLLRDGCHYAQNIPCSIQRKRHTGRGMERDEPTFDAAQKLWKTVCVESHPSMTVCVRPQGISHAHAHI
jgi:hypothetical protein